MSAASIEGARPKIFRCWLQREGRFVWTVDQMPSYTWTGATPHPVRRRWNEAYRWCALQNSKEKESEAQPNPL